VERRGIFFAQAQLLLLNLLSTRFKFALNKQKTEGNGTQTIIDGYRIILFQAEIFQPLLNYIRTLARPEGA
jgi:hypothetical protein